MVCELYRGKGACQIRVANYDLVGCKGNTSLCDPTRRAIRQISYGITNPNEPKMSRSDLPYYEPLPHELESSPNGHHSSVLQNLSAISSRWSKPLRIL